MRIDRKNVKSVVKGEKVDTGLKSLGVIIGHNTNIGIGVQAMPGILVGSGCIVGPGSLILENIEGNTKYYSKFKSVVKKRE